MTNDLRICFIGDSFVNGTRDDTGLGWVGRVAAHLRGQGWDLTTYNLGIRRDTSREVRARWREETERRLPVGCDGRLVFAFGANDAVLENGEPRVPLSETLAHAEAILGAAAGWKSTLVIGPLPLALPGHGDLLGRMRLIGAGMQERCRLLRLPYLDLIPALLADGRWAQEIEGDGAHPSAGGYQRLAQLILESAQWRTWLAAAPPP